MASNLFIEYSDLNINSLTIDFNNFVSSKLSNLSPTKKLLDYGSNDQQFISNATDIIFVNLAQNKNFRERSEYLKSSLLPIKNLFDDAKKSNNSSIKARLVFMIHFSKSNLKPDNFENILPFINTIEVCPNKWFPQLDILFATLAINPIIKKTIFDTVQELIEGPFNNTDLSKISIEYYLCSMEGSNGFSAPDKIYVNLQLIRRLKGMMTSAKIYSESEIIDVLKLHCIRLYVHESSHVILREKMGDFNFSTPTLEEKKSELKVEYSPLEAGYIAEEKIFGAKIDLFESISKKELNLKYCQQFIKALLNGEQFSFDFKLAGTTPIDSNRIVAMGMDFLRRKTEKLLFF